jgi:hypothetical protein
VRRFLALLLSSALSLAACGGDSGPDPADNPKAALRAAFEKIGEYEGLTITLTLDSDTDSLVAISEGELTDEQAQTVLDSSLAITAKQGDKPEDAQLDLTADISGDTAELKLVDQVLYARADVSELVERFGGDTSELNQFRQQAPPGFEFIGPLLDGEWVAFEGLKEFAEQFGGAQQTEEDADFQKDMAEKLGAAVEDNSTVESVGEDDVGHHLEASIAVRGLYDAFLEVAGSAPGMGTLPPGAFPPASEIPNENLTIDAWIDGGDVVQLGFDFIRIAETFGGDPPPSGVERLGLLVGIEEFTGNVETPDPAETVDFGQLMQGLLGVGAGGFMQEEGEAEVGEPQDLEDLCKQLKGAPDEVVEQFADECPELQQ